MRIQPGIGRCALIPLVRECKIGCFDNYCNICNCTLSHPHMTVIKPLPSRLHLALHSLLYSCSPAFHSLASLQSSVPQLA